MPRLKVAHLYQESGIRFHAPQAAQLHIYHTLHGLQQAGHHAQLVALQGRQVLCTDDLEVFRSDLRLDHHFARLAMTGTGPFMLFERGVRRLQTTLRLPYLALFDSYRLFEAAAGHLRGYDLIHERFNLLALGGVWASRKLGLPLVLEVNADLLEQRRFKGVPERGLRRVFAQWATRVCFGAAAKIICISTGLQEQLRTKWHIPADRLAVLPVAADVEAFGAAQPSAHVRQSLGLTVEPVVLWMGGFFPWHDLTLLLESFALVRQRCSQARLVLVGDGPTRPLVVQQIQAKGLEHAVIMPGAVAHARMPALLSIADVSAAPAAPVSASRGGTGTPLKLFEYMAAGNAIVATAVAQAADVVEHNQTGLLVEAGDVRGFADAILRLLDDAAERRRLGGNARRQAIERYSWDQYTRQLEAIYRNVLD